MKSLIANNCIEPNMPDNFLFYSSTQLRFINMYIYIRDVQNNGLGSIIDCQKNRMCVNKECFL